MNDKKLRELTDEYTKNLTTKELKIFTQFLAGYIKLLMENKDLAEESSIEIQKCFQLQVEAHKLVTDLLEYTKENNQKNFNNVN